MILAPSVLVPALFGYMGGGLGGGMSEIARVMAHSAIWTVVAQFIRHSPVVVVIVCFALACGWLLHVHRIKVRQTKARERSQR